MPGRGSNGVHHAWGELKIWENLHVISLKFIFTTFPFVLSRITYCIQPLFMTGCFYCLRYPVACYRLQPGSHFACMAVSADPANFTFSTHSARDWKYSCIRKTCTRTALWKFTAVTNTKTNFSNCSVANIHERNIPVETTYCILQDVLQESVCESMDWTYFVQNKCTEGIYLIRHESVGFKRGWGGMTIKLQLASWKETFLTRVRTQWNIRRGDRRERQQL